MACSRSFGRPVSHRTLSDERETIIRKVIELVVVLALFSALIWLSVGLQGPFSMTGSAAVFTLGVAFLVAFLRFILFRWRSAIWFFAGVLLSTLWYPFAYTVIGSTYANGPGLSSPRFYMDLLLALRIEAVYGPLLMLLAASLAGGALGYIVGRFTAPRSLTARSGAGSTRLASWQPRGGRWPRPPWWPF